MTVVELVHPLSRELSGSGRVEDLVDQRGSEIFTSHVLSTVTS